MHLSAELSLPCDDRDFAEWHQGCPWCAVWVVWLDDAATRQAVAAGRAALGDCLLPRYARQPHITVAYRGLCADGDAHEAGEFGLQALRRDLGLLKNLAQQPFVLQLRGVGSFTSVPYLAVAEGGEALAALHAALVPQQPVPGWHYVPHVTLGHYGQRLPLAQALQKLKEQQELGEGLPPQPVGQLALVRYASADMAGPLVLEGCFDLAAGRYSAAPGALWAELGDA
ncbi:MAG: 2'-5' RNA ligase family protein [Comamonas sp.]